MRQRFIVILAGVLIIFLAGFAIFKGMAQFNRNQASKEFYNLAKAQELKGDLLGARDNYERIVKETPNSSLVSDAQKKTEELSIRLFFSNITTPEGQVYEVVSGDTLGKIAKKFNTTTELLMKSNGLNDARIVVGKKLKVPNVIFSVVVDKSENTLLLKANEEVFKTYLVSTGKNNCTPAGTFKITSKLPNPVWYKAGVVLPPESPDNILGTRWLGFDLSSYGIHGTTDPQSIGKQATQGCVRMQNKDVEELYAILPTGTEVTIVD